MNIGYTPVFAKEKSTKKKLRNVYPSDAEVIRLPPRAAESGKALDLSKPSSTLPQQRRQPPGFLQVPEVRFISSKKGSLLVGKYSAKRAPAYAPSFTDEGGDAMDVDQADPFEPRPIEVARPPPPRREPERHPAPPPPDLREELAHQLDAERQLHRTAVARALDTTRAASARADAEAARALAAEERARLATAARDEHSAHAERARTETRTAAQRADAEAARAAAADARAQAAELARQEAHKLAADAAAERDGQRAAAAHSAGASTLAAQRAVAEAERAAAAEARVHAAENAAREAHQRVVESDARHAQEMLAAHAASEAQRQALATHLTETQGQRAAHDARAHAEQVQALQAAHGVAMATAQSQLARATALEGHAHALAAEVEKARKHAVKSKVVAALLRGLTAVSKNATKRVELERDQARADYSAATAQHRAAAEDQSNSAMHLLGINKALQERIAESEQHRGAASSTAASRETAFMAEGTQLAGQLNQAIAALHAKTISEGKFAAEVQRLEGIVRHLQESHAAESMVRNSAEKAARRLRPPSGKRIGIVKRSVVKRPGSAPQKMSTDLVVRPSAHLAGNGMEFDFGGAAPPARESLRVRHGAHVEPYDDEQGVNRPSAVTKEFVDYIRNKGIIPLPGGKFGDLITGAPVHPKYIAELRQELIDAMRARRKEYEPRDRGGLAGPSHPARPASPAGRLGSLAPHVRLHGPAFLPRLGN